MHPVMEVRRHIYGKKPLYELILSRDNLDHLMSGCPDFDRLVGSYGSATFSIFNGERMPERFHYGSIGYWANMGAPVPLLPPNVTSVEFERLAAIAYSNLEEAIRSSGLIPIIDGELELGYVKLII